MNDHNIIHIHNNVMRDWRYSTKYSLHSVWMWGILCKILSVPQNIVMNMNSVMTHICMFATSILSHAHYYICSTLISYKFHGSLSPIDPKCLLQSGCLIAIATSNVAQDFKLCTLLPPPLFSLLFFQCFFVTIVLSNLCHSSLFASSISHNIK